MECPKRFCSRLAAGLLSAAAVMTSACAVTGTVNAGSGLRLRNGVNTGAAILTTLPNGTQVEVSGVTEEGWYQVTYQDTVGYVCGDYLVVDETEKQSLEVVGAPVYGRVTAGPLNVRSRPGTDGDKLGKLSAGTVVRITGESEGWYQTDDGYLCADYVEIVEASEAASSAAGSQVVAYAKEFLGYPYVHGGASPKGFDCSGFVQYIYSRFGISLNRTSADQMSNGVVVSDGDLQPGDLVFFLQNSSYRRASHVGIYIGGGQFIHASSPSTGVIISDMDSHTGRGYVGARRVL